MTALTIRKDRSAVAFRRLAKAEPDGRVSRRILAVANALSGKSRKEAAEAAGTDRQTLRDWVARYNAHGLEGLADRRGEGRPPALSVQEQADLPGDHRHGRQRSRGERVVGQHAQCSSGLPRKHQAQDLAAICAERFGKRLHPWSVGRMLHRLGLSRQKTRPSHPMKDPADAEAFKKSPASAAKNSAYA